MRPPCGCQLSHLAQHGRCKRAYLAPYGAGAGRRGAEESEPNELLVSRELARVNEMLKCYPSSSERPISKSLRYAACPCNHFISLWLPCHEATMTVEENDCERGLSR